MHREIRACSSSSITDVAEFLSFSDDSIVSIALQMRLYCLVDGVDTLAL